MKINWYQVRIPAVAALMILMLAACGGSADPGVDDGAAQEEEEGQTQADDAEEAEEPQPAGDGDTLTVAIPGDIETLDTCCANFIRSHHALMSIYEMPVIHPPGEEVMPGIFVSDGSQLEGLYFESWEQHEDNVTYTIHLREGLTFHNGKPITAEDIRYMFERSLNTDGGANWLLRNIAFVTEPPEVIDDYTLELRSDQYSPLTMQALYMTSSGAFDPEVIEEHATEEDPWATEWMARNVAGGSGPYQMVSHVPDQEVVFEAWEDYWRGPAPIKRIVWKIVPSPAERVQLLQTGAVDMAEGLGTEEFQALEGVAGVNVLKIPSRNMAYVGMNNGIAPFDDVAVRQAVSYGVDYDDILENVYRGDARRLWGPLSGTSEYALGEDAGYTRDVDRASQLLEESGYSGEPVTLSIDSARAEHQLLAVRLQSHLREIGMEVEIEQLTSAVFAERKAAKELQMIVDESLAWIDDPNYALSLTLQCGVFGNYVDYCNEDVDQIIMDGWGEADPQARQEMFETAQRTIIEEAPWVFIAQPDFKLAVREGITGYVHHVNEIPRYYDFRFED